MSKGIEIIEAQGEAGFDGVNMYYKPDKNNSLTFTTDANMGIGDRMIFNAKPLTQNEGTIYFGDPDNIETGKLWRSKDWSRMMMIGRATIKVNTIRRSHV